MTKPISLIVTDSGPLITLSLAGALDVLISKPDVRVFIPDLIRFEVLRHMDKPGAQDIDNWIRANEPDRVCVASTEEFAEFQLLLSLKPTAKTKSRGEAAASEILERLLSKGDTIGILLFEDGDVRANRYVINAPDNVLMMSTAHFLQGLEVVHVIESANDIIDRVTAIRGNEIKNPHIHATPGAEERQHDWHEDFSP